MQSLEKKYFPALDTIFLFLKIEIRCEKLYRKRKDGEDGREGVTRKMQNAFRACQET
jgi:hypothetical protein